MDPVLLAFITGLTTGGLSCLAVQGGLLASSIANEVEQSVQKQSAQVQRAKPGTASQQQLQVRAGRPILLFLTAKLIAYTLLGFVLGWVGSVFQLTPTMRAILLVAIGVFMVGNALRMLNVHPIFRYFALEPPSFVTRYIRRKSKDQSSALTPLFLGALTVFIPCGVTQAMMAVAMATGSPVAGATIMFAFVLGTSPVFFAVAYLATTLGARLEKNFMRIVAVIVLVLGLVSIDSGLTLAGWPYSVSNLRMAAAADSSPAPVSASAQPTDQPVTQPTAQSVAQPTVQPSSQAAAPTARPAQSQKPAQGAGSADLANMVGPAVSTSSAVTITVTNSGYSPVTTRAKPDQPVRLALVTKNTYSCARAFVIRSLKIEKMLPETGTVLIDIPPQRAGSKLFYSCSMGMYSGVIVFDG
jgi:sulfite exporter TauE/SafE